MKCLHNLFRSALRSALSDLGQDGPIPVRVRALNLGEGDVIVLTMPGVLSEATMEQLNHEWRKAIPNNKVVILDGGMDLKGVIAVVREMPSVRLIDDGDEVLS